MERQGPNATKAIKLYRALKEIEAELSDCIGSNETGMDHAKIYERC